MQGPGSVVHLMEGNDGVLPEDAQLMPATRESSLNCVGNGAGAPLRTNGKASNRSWLWRRGEARRGLSAGSWGAQASPWQLSGASLSFVVVTSAALGAGAAYLVSRRL